MNSNPSFYPKHLARQYVSIWNGGGSERLPSAHVAPQQQQQVDKFAPAQNVNGQKSETPPVGSGRLAILNHHINSVETSPILSTGSMSPMSPPENLAKRPSSNKVLQGLPNSFISAMRKLFDLLDIENDGRVHIDDIADNWSPDAAGSVLPPNIVPSLRKVTTPDGYLTFERFCAGLKIAILRHGAQRHRQSDECSMESPEPSGSGTALMSSPLSRTSSMPNLPADSSTDKDDDDLEMAEFSVGERRQYLGAKEQCAPSPSPSEPGPSSKLANPANLPAGPPKPPRDPSRVSLVEFRTNVEASIASRNYSGSTASLPAAVISTSAKAHLTKIGTEPEFIWKAPPPPFISQTNLLEQRRPYIRRSIKKPTTSSSSSRRHTLQGGVDYGMIRSIEQWEQEKAILEEGIAVVQKAKEWYHIRLKEVQNQLNFTVEPRQHISVEEANQERVNFEMSAIHDINHKLRALVKADGRLAVEPVPSELSRRIERLQEQNRMLTDEVSRQSNRVTSLEQDKRSLIKQLFQQSSTNSISSNASTLR